MTTIDQNSLRTVTTGLTLGESPRWHDGRLWCANWGAAEVLAVDDGGRREVMLRAPHPIPFSIDWLPDGRLLLVSGAEARLVRRQHDGTLVTHADLSALARGWNEIVVDGRGNIYVNGSDFDFLGGGPFVPGVIALVTPDGQVRQVASDIRFPNGMVVTPDNSTLIVAESFAGKLTAFDIARDGTLSHRRVWADLGMGGDGMCMDAEGAIWTPCLQGTRPSVIRVREGGEVLQRIGLDQFCFACMLGGDDRPTLYMMLADWRGPENARAMMADRTGKVLAVTAPARRAGWP
jgi:sugar lactone lactonase YvrE